MHSETDDVSKLQTQLAEKQELVAILTSQLEKTVTQLDRLKRTGAERNSAGFSGSPPFDQSELGSQLITAIEEWQEIEPAGRIVRIEEGIERILDLLQTQANTFQSNPVAETASTSPPPAASTPASDPSAAPTQDFWEAAKARLLGDDDANENPTSVTNAEQTDSEPAAPEPVDEGFSEADFLQAGTAPAPPKPLVNANDLDELKAAVDSRDTYIQHLTTRVRLAESKKYLPVEWELLSDAPDQYRNRLESLETLLQDHLRQAEVAHSLERALLARERAKLAQIKHQLEQQIKRMAPPAPVEAATEPNETPAKESGSDAERRWKRIFTR